MEKKDKNIYVIIFAIIIGLALIATIVTYIVNSKNNNTDNTNKNNSNLVIFNEIEKEKYSSFNVTYENNTEVTYTNPNNNGFEQNLIIENGFLKITNKTTNETYTLSNIKELKNVMLLCDGTDSECQRYVLLTNTGKVFYSSNNLYKINSVKDFDNIFTILKTDYNIIDIGYVSWAYPSAQQSLVIKNDKGQEYLVDLNTNSFEKINTEKNDKSTCGNACKEYTDIEIDKENIIEYNDNGNMIKINVYPAYDYESSKFIIYFNDKEIYNIVDFTTNVKVFKFTDIYVVEYKQDQSQCGNVIDILIDKNGNVIGIPGDNEKDTFNELTPKLMKTEFDENTNQVIAYKETCSMCSSSNEQIGFKYNYLLENNKLILQSKEEIYCK